MQKSTTFFFIFLARKGRALFLLPILLAFLNDGVQTAIAGKMQSEISKVGSKLSTTLDLFEERLKKAKEIQNKEFEKIAKYRN